MCRMAATVGSALSPAALLFDGDHSLEQQSYRPRELLHGHVNVDGYGVAWYHEGSPVRIAEARPTWHDPDLEPLLRTIRGSPVLAAVRNLTPGIVPERSGVPPLLMDRWTFVLNGFVAEFRSRAMRHLHALLPDDLYGRLGGTSDTEALFLLLVRFARDGGSLSAAVRRTVGAAIELGAALDVEVQLNVLASDGRTVVATRMASGRSQNSLYLARSLPGGGEGVTIASEPLDSRLAWEPVPLSSLVEAELEGRVRTLPLGGS